MANTEKKSKKSLIAIIVAIIVVVAAVIAVVALKGGNKDANSNTDQEKAKITIAVPNDTTNEARALLLLQEQGYITLDESKGITATISDITDIQLLKQKHLYRNLLPLFALGKTWPIFFHIWKVHQFYHYKL